MYTLADYLLDVVRYLGSEEIFGVPGDYNLQFLDHITKRKDMQWVGNANELNAAYMADGYARQKGFATFITTFGVGELSALNGFAGSKAEHVPVLEIVGSPTTAVQKNGKLVHHTFGDGDFLKFEKAHRALGFEIGHITKNNAIDEINRILKYIHTTKQPAYLNLPTDLVDMPVSQDLKGNIPALFKQSQAASNQELIAQLKQALNQAKKPVIIVGHEAQRFDLGPVIEQFITTNNIPISTLGLGKGLINEELPQFIGTYNGTLSEERTKKIVDAADLVLLIGVKLTDSVTGAFTHSFTDLKTIKLNYQQATIFEKTYQANYDFVQSVNSLAQLPLGHADYETLSNVNQDLKALNATNAALTQAFYGQAMQAFIEPNQVLVAEQGTSFFGLAANYLPKMTAFIGQPLWGSIGYTFPAMIGSQLANRDQRNILSIGEGSLQLTIQEFGMAFREKITPIVFIIDNNGYTVERIIHGMTESYNDIPQLNYELVPMAFGGTANDFEFYQVATEKQLVDTMQAARKASDKMVIVQVIMDQTDAPKVLAAMGKLFEKQNQVEK